MTITTIPGSNVTLEARDISGIFYVIIAIDGEFWDHREFDTAAARDAWIAKPDLSGKRGKMEAAAKHEEARMAAEEAHAIACASLMGCNRGRRIGPKPGAA